MSQWYVHRENGKIVSTHEEIQPEYAEELLDTETSNELFTYIQKNILNPVPKYVSAAQMIRALDQMELLETVDAVVAQADTLTKRLWARSGSFDRDDPLLVGIGVAINKTNEEIDDLFRLAASL